VKQRKPKQEPRLTQVIRSSAPSSNTLATILRVVKRIPRGRVMTYGGVAAAAGMPRAARMVGNALRRFGGTVPWQRVVGRRSARTAHITIGDVRTSTEQRRLLENEGVKFDVRGAIDLTEFGLPSRSRNRSHPRRR
jgi:methylated-DNA-protein-cysteine methyltransferase-like protein